LFGGLLKRTLEAEPLDGFRLGGGQRLRVAVANQLHHVLRVTLVAVRTKTLLRHGALAFYGGARSGIHGTS
ncbi:MAG: hypothetical protein ABWY64_17190, partial [Tardiphaga sp.]